MRSVQIEAVPNQSFSFSVDNNQWQITLKSLAGIVAASLQLNGTGVIDNARCVANGLIIPYRYLENGNFFFSTANQELPDYTKFNISQSLIYLSPSDLLAIHAPFPSRWTQANFNQLGGLPLRFKPQGYTLAP